MKKITSGKNGSTSGASPAKQPEISLLLHDIRSVYNVGSIFRTADAFGVARIYLSGYTPTPIDRFGRKRADVAKVALGAEDSVAWRRLEGSPLEFIKKYKIKDNVVIIALEQDPRSVDYRHVIGKIYRENLDNSKILLILGNEIGGISRDILDHTDIIAEIPMRGTKESLNVSVAAGVALFGMFG
jgi:tRNA G18 (ribose-2'-O)-methylase SpoU